MTGLILNPRGTSGSGKTELARRILSEYGWRQDRLENQKDVEPLYRPGRTLPFAYRIRHPSAGRPLVVIGHYQRTSGGCDTIRKGDGGLPEVMRFAGEVALCGHDVLIEGLRLSSDVALSTQLASAHRLYVLALSTPLEQCVRNVLSRRRAAKSIVPAIARNIAEEHRRVEDACEHLREYATIEVLAFDRALARARELLGLTISDSGRDDHTATPHVLQELGRARA